MSSEISNQGNPANQQYDWLSQVYKVYDKEAEQVNGGSYDGLANDAALANDPSPATIGSETAQDAAQDIKSAFVQLFDVQKEILSAKLEGKVLGAILSAYNDALAFIK